MKSGMSDNLFEGELPITKEWMKLCYDKLKKDSHFYVFTNINSLHEYLNSAKECGFKLHNVISMIKDTKMPNRWYLKYTEFVLFFRKGKAFPINDIVYTTLYPKTMFEKILYGSCVNFNHNIRVMYDILGNVLYNLRLHGYEYNFLNGVEFKYVDFEKCLKDDISKNHNIDYKHDTIVTLKNAKYYTIVYTYNNISYNCICDFTGKIYDNYFGYANVYEMIKDLEYNEKLKHNMNLIYNEDV